MVKSVVDGTLTWLLGDHLGSTSVTAQADGAFQSEMRYTAFGETRFSTGPTPTDYQYTGQRQEAEFGLYFYKARWYDPASAHFTQADTLIPEPGNPLALDRYAYVYNNSLRFTDPTGHFTNDQLEEYFGEDWKTEIQKFSDEMQEMLLDDDVQLGTVLMYSNDKSNQAAMFVEDEEGDLIIWDIENKETAELFDVDQNEIFGYYLPKSEKNYELEKRFNSNDIAEEFLLETGWNFNDQEHVVIYHSRVFDTPNAWNYAGMVVSGAGVYIEIAAVMAPTAVINPIGWGLIILGAGFSFGSSWEDSTMIVHYQLEPYMVDPKWP
jgi:RHS repeat-associated protein